LPATAYTDGQLELSREIGVVLRRIATFLVRRVILVGVTTGSFVRHGYGDRRERGRQILIEQARIDISRAHVVDIIGKGLAVYDLETEVHVVAQEVFDTYTHRDVQLRKFVILSVGIFGKPFTFRMQRLQIHPVGIACAGIMIGALWIEMEQT